MQRISWLAAKTGQLLQDYAPWSNYVQHAPQGFTFKTYAFWQQTAFMSFVFLLRKKQLLFPNISLGLWFLYPRQSVLEETNTMHRLYHPFIVRTGSYIFRQ
jgi:hypothetical protein